MSARNIFNSAVESTRQLDLFEKHLDCYTFDAFHSKEQTEFVHSDFLTNQAETNRRIKLVLPKHLWGTDTDANVLKTLTLRSLIYWGRDVDDLINWPKIQEHFGFGKSDTQLDPQLVSDTRYAIVAPMRVMAHGDLPEHGGNAIHVWAVNLESTDTADYKTLIEANKTPGGFNIPAIEEAYFQRHLEVLDLVMRSALTSLGPNQTAHVFSALLGAGCFLRACTTELRDSLLWVQFRAVATIMSTYANVHFTLRIFSPEEFTPELVEDYIKLSSVYPKFTVGVGRAEGNVLANVPTSTDATATFVVNAGDPRSWIGNGMSKDPTVEGFLVANAKGFNNQYRNTSYLHNVRFNPSLLEPANWLRGD